MDTLTSKRNNHLADQLLKPKWQYHTNLFVKRPLVRNMDADQNCDCRVYAASWLHVEYHHAFSILVCRLLRCSYYALQSIRSLQIPSFQYTLRQGGWCHQWFFRYQWYCWKEWVDMSTGSSGADGSYYGQLPREFCCGSKVVWGRYNAAHWLGLCKYYTGRTDAVELYLGSCCTRRRDYASS